MKNESLFTENISSVKRAFILWDGLGLVRRGSGIFHHGEKLYASLAQQQINPQLCLPFAPEHGFSPADKTTVLPPAWYGKRLSQLKLVWPQRVGAFWEHKELPKARLFHGLANVNLPWSNRFFAKWKTVLTIHDLIPILAADTAGGALKLQTQLAYKMILPKVDRIVCVSEWTKKSLLERYPFVKDKTLVIPNGFPRYVGKKKARSSARVNVLTVSRFEAYKKFDDLLRVIEKAPEYFHFHVVTDLAGKKWLEENAREGTKKRMSILFQLAEAELARKYEESDIYLHPSLYEGFGLPIADALTHGLAVVFRSGSAVDEVAGTVGSFPVSTNSGVEEWLEALEQARKALEASDFQSILKSHLEERPDWGAAAVQLCKIYANLLTNA